MATLRCLHPDRRDEGELLRALTRALATLNSCDDPETAIRESFGHAAAGLRAEKAILIQVAPTLPADIEILGAAGLSPENEAACRALRSSPGISPTLVRTAIADGSIHLIENSQVRGLDNTSSLLDRPYSVLCAPIRDLTSGAPMAVAYFESEGRRAFGPEDLEWLTAYGVGLGYLLALRSSPHPRSEELDAEWRRDREADGPEIVGDSAATRKLISGLNALLPSTTRTDAPPILVTGESGTGKDLVARYLHHYSRKRAHGPFLTFNCSAIRGDLAEARLFGHMRGAFTGALADSPGLFRAADKGTLFLDEIGEMPAEGQALLLRALESRCVQAVGGTKEFPVDVQLVLATNRDLEGEVAAKRFREDLYYRVKGLGVHVAPLRDPARIADIRPLLAFYIRRHERSLKKRTLGLTTAAFREMLQFSWPGNVRQLNNVCLALVTHASPGSPIDVSDIQRLCPEVLSGPSNSSPEVYLEDEEVTYRDVIRSVRKRLILDRLQRNGGRASAASASLGISEPTFYRYLAEANRLP